MNRLLLFSLCMILLIDLLTAKPAVAEKWQFQYGLGASVSQSVYLQGEDVFNALPYFKATYKNWSFGPEYGIGQYQVTSDNSPVQFFLGLGLRDQTYKSIFTSRSDRSKHPIFNDYESGSAELTFTSTVSWQQLSLRVEQDISNRSKGTGVTLNYEHPVKLPPPMGLTSLGIGANWLSQRYIDYVYGISGDNINLPLGRTEYRGEASTNIYAYAQHIYPLNKNWLLVSQIRYETLDQAIRNSPIVDADKLFRASAFVIYTWN